MKGLQWPESMAYGQVGFNSNLLVPVPELFPLGSSSQLTTGEESAALVHRFDLEFRALKPWHCSQLWV